MSLGSTRDSTIQVLWIYRSVWKKLSCVLMKPSDVPECPSVSPNDSVPFAIKYLNPNWVRNLCNSFIVTWDHEVDFPPRTNTWRTAFLTFLKKCLKKNIVDHIRESTFSSAFYYNVHLWTTSLSAVQNIFPHSNITDLAGKHIFMNAHMHFGFGQHELFCLFLAQCWNE